ncbi:LysR family transcriptional regulator [Fluviibacterium sp. DFM31]|uniref:LysR family transcriptional regulator n=1 Tax=Meridianimarinicoccus marinus TaxID=3231483 RepID=A0ABV3L7V4_9RHOB
MALHLVPRGMLYVEAVAEAGSIQAASREIGIAASAIDRQIVLLEQRLGVQLFERQRSGMSLSPAGEQFLALTRRWRSDERQIWSSIKQMQGLELGHVRLLAMDSMANGVIPRLIGKLFENYPRVQLDIEFTTPDSVTDHLTKGEVDIALAFNIKPHRDLHIMWTTDLPLGCLAAPDHPVAQKPEIRLSEAIRHPVAMQSRSLAIRRLLESKHGWIFSELRPPVATNSLQLVKHLAVSGSHVAITSELDAAPELIDGSLVFVPVMDRNVMAQTASVVISTRRSLSQIGRKVGELVCDELEQMLADVRRTDTQPPPA